MNIKINEHQIWRKWMNVCVCAASKCEIEGKKLTDSGVYRLHTQLKLLVELENYACTIMLLRLKRIQLPKIRQIAKNTLTNRLQFSWVHWNRSKCTVHHMPKVRLNRIPGAVSTARCWRCRRCRHCRFMIIGIHILLWPFRSVANQQVIIVLCSKCECVKYQMYQIINYRSSGFSFEFCAKRNVVHAHTSTFTCKCMYAK